LADFKLKINALFLVKQHSIVLSSHPLQIFFHSLHQGLGQLERLSWRSSIVLGVEIRSLHQKHNLTTHCYFSHHYIQNGKFTPSSYLIR